MSPGRYDFGPVPMRAGLLLVLVLLVLPASASAAPAPVATIDIEGVISPVTLRLVGLAIDRAQAERAQALVIQLDTPGGLERSMRAIVQRMMNAEVPVIVYVGPTGARAASAGVFITMAAHVAAMAPGTTIGAAHPVGGAGEDIPGEMGKKIENFTTSFSESIAKQRGRNVEWAAKAVRESVSVTADEAAKLKVVDLVARDLDDLLARVEGRSVEIGGEKRTLHLKGSEVREYTMRLAQRILAILADPNIVYPLMMLGLLGLYIELTHPGAVFPGVAGAICLLLALTAMQILPVNYGALALIVLGVALLVAEAFLPTFGVVGVGGFVAFLFGSLFLFSGNGEEMQVARGLVFGAGGGVALFMLVVAVFVARRRKQPSRLGVEGMIGAVGVARERLAPTGTVVVHGEYWTADADEAIESGAPIEVTAVEGLRLRVRGRTAGATR
jgi:membrane-bound serine protease (ClpP class)